MFGQSIVGRGTSNWSKSILAAPPLLDGERPVSSDRDLERTFDEGDEPCTTGADATKNPADAEKPHLPQGADGAV
jgi:hypothetical protein